MKKLKTLILPCIFALLPVEKIIAGEVSVPFESIAITGSGFVSGSVPVIRVHNPNSFDLDIDVVFLNMTLDTPLTSGQGSPLGSIETYSAFAGYDSPESITIPENSHWAASAEDFLTVLPPPVDCSVTSLTLPPGLVENCFRGVLNISWESSFVRNNGTTRTVTPPKIFLESQSLRLDVTTGDFELRTTAITQIQ